MLSEAKHLWLVFSALVDHTIRDSSLRSE